MFQECMYSWCFTSRKQCFGSNGSFKIDIQSSRDTNQEIIAFIIEIDKTNLLVHILKWVEINSKIFSSLMLMSYNQNYSYVFIERLYIKMNIVPSISDVTSCWKFWYNVGIRWELFLDKSSMYNANIWQSFVTLAFW